MRLLIFLSIRQSAYFERDYAKSSVDLIIPDSMVCRVSATIAHWDQGGHGRAMPDFAAVAARAKTATVFESCAASGP
ncbi:hypothetical protein BLAT2472_40628 [Burkholderia latens]